MGRKRNKQKKRKLHNHPLIGKKASGTIDVTRHGKGYVNVGGWEQDVLIYPEYLKSAIDGDTVQVKIKKVKTKGRPVGQVIRITKHAQSEFIGHLEVNPNFAFFIPDKENIHTDIYIPTKNLKNAEGGDQVLVRVLEWQEKRKNPIGEVVEILTGKRENDIAMKEILIDHGFPLQSSKEAIKEAKQISAVISKEEIEKRIDMRSIPTLTIDPKSAKDFDDALSIQTLKNDHIEVGVHIADVSYFVKPNSALDIEAYRRATSVYLPDRVCPMLPEKISNFLCSLRPDEDKLAFSVIFQLDKKGTIHQFSLSRTLIRSDKRMTYEDAQEIIDGKQGKWTKAIKTLHGIAQNLRTKRFAKGAINFSSEEVRFSLDENGYPTGLTVKENKPANQLIEEFMLLANKTVARYVSEKKVNNKAIPFPYRIHDNPNSEKLETYAAFVSRLGYHLNLNTPKTIAQSFNELLQKAHQKPEHSVLEQLGIRTMSKAAYAPDNIGHFGLGFEKYCHFTSPIRRYPDVMVHRILQTILEDNIIFDKEMGKKCLHCSDKERKAIEAERAANKYKQVEYMSQFIGHTLDAVITGVAAMGFWAATIEQRCEGMVSKTALIDWDIFDYDEASYSLKGLHTGLIFQMGDKVSVQVVATNLEKRQIDFDWVPPTPSKK